MSVICKIGILPYCLGKGKSAKYVSRRLRVFHTLNADFALKTRPTAEASSPFFVTQKNDLL